MMEEAVPSLKRQREEEEETALVDGEFVEEALKRQKSYKDIISILEEDEYEPNEDISSLLTTLQQEISPSSSSSSESSVSDNPNTSAAATTETHSSPTLEHCTSFSSKDEYEEDGERVMRHLLEASDDELGIPNSDVVTGAEEGKSGEEESAAAPPVVGEDLMNGCGFGVGADFDFGVGGIWEFEDDTANYYAMLQSELFLGAGV